MTDNQIKNAIQTAIKALKAESPILDYASVHERSTAHRLAVHMEVLFNGWNVDCEYDRDGQREKFLLGIKDCNNKKKTDKILPDIIVHRREKSGLENNLLVIELKKDATEDPCDKKKLELLTKVNGYYQYQLGLYININNGAFICTWYKNGEKVV
jgi:hypothetical protein